MADVPQQAKVCRLELKRSEQAVIDGASCSSLRHKKKSHKQRRGDGVCSGVTESCIETMQLGVLFTHFLLSTERLKSNELRPCLQCSTRQRESDVRALLQ
jgi:hypothetical protein